MPKAVAALAAVFGLKLQLKWKWRKKKLKVCTERASPLQPLQASSWWKTHALLRPEDEWDHCFFFFLLGERLSVMMKMMIIFKGIIDRYINRFFIDLRDKFTEMMVVRMEMMMMMMKITKIKVVIVMMTMIVVVMIIIILW